MSTHPWAALAAFLAIMFGAGFAGGMATFPEIPGWYAALAKPAWTPPDSVFGPVWNGIFLLTAISGWLTWRRVGLQPEWVGLYGLQVGLNVLWSVVFFALHSPAGALAVIAALWVVLILLTRRSWKVRPLAGALLLPYVAWVSFATALNGAVAAMN